MWRVLHECVVDGYLVRSMSSLYDRSRACVGHFEVRRGLRQGCVTSPWLFIIFFDRVVGHVNDRSVGSEVKLRYENGTG